MSGAEIVACPFCGSQSARVIETGDLSHTLCVCCDDCGARGPERGVQFGVAEKDSGGYSGAWEKAIVAWNGRSA